MGSPRTLLRGARRRSIAIAVGVATGTAVGALTLAPASPDPSPPVFRVLHAAPALVTAGRQVVLGAATACTPVGVDGCRISRAVAHVRPTGAPRWTPVAGARLGGAYRFAVPATLVPRTGFSYWLEFDTVAGTAIDYPPTGGASPISVGTTAGFRVRSLARFSWADVRDSDGTAAFLPYGSGPGEVGTTGGLSGQDVIGPSSYAVGPGGELYVVDQANGRIEVF